MKRLECYIKAISGILLIYITYISYIVYLSERYLLMIRMAQTGTWANLGMARAGFALPTLVCLVFVYALWLLGCIRTYALLDALPAFTLSIIWLLTSSSPISASNETEPFRVFIGGGALACAFLGFSVASGLARWMRHKEKPVLNIKSLFLLTVYVAALYALDNLTPAFRSWIDRSGLSLTEEVRRQYMILSTLLTRLAYPLLAGYAAAAFFVKRSVQHKRIGVLLLSVCAVCVFLNVFPHGIISERFRAGILYAQSTVFLTGLSSTLWPYMTGVLLTAGLASIFRTRTAHASP